MQHSQGGVCNAMEVAQDSWIKPPWQVHLLDFGACEDPSCEVDAPRRANVGISRDGASVRCAAYSSEGANSLGHRGKLGTRHQKIFAGRDLHN